MRNENGDCLCQLIQSIAFVSLSNNETVLTSFNFIGEHEVACDLGAHRYTARIEEFSVR